jgi:phospholipase/lecithinase/hemolysin
VLAAFLVLVLAAAGGSRAQGPLPHLVIFGDSLSDSGNVFVIGNGEGMAGHLARVNNTPPNYVLDPPSLLIPSAAYARGGHHLTNGDTWIEVLAKSLGYPVNAQPAFASDNPRATNYAIAGARAYDDGVNLNLSGEVSFFLQDFLGSAPEGALYVIEIGNSDVRDALVSAAGGGDPSVILGQGIQSIAGNIQALYMAGARRFLVLNVANIGLIPSVRALGTAASTGATQLSAGFNAGLDAALSALQGLPGIQITRYDLFAAVSDMYDSPLAYGLTEVLSPCITPGEAPFVCKDPDAYLFWDGIHPTRAVHAIVAGQVQALLSQ